MFVDIDLSKNCTIKANGDIIKGTCSETTVDILIDPACTLERVQQHDLIRYTVYYLIKDSCTEEVFAISKRRTIATEWQKMLKQKQRGKEGRKEKGKNRNKLG